MDHIDSEILLLLQKNARISMSEISSYVNLSVSAVSEHLKKLEQSNLIEQYTTLLNPTAFSKSLSVFITLESSSSMDTVSFGDYIQQERDITECHRIAGTCDYLLKVTTNDNTALEAIISRIKTFAGIDHLKVNIITSTPKFHPSISPSL